MTDDMQNFDPNVNRRSAPRLAVNYDLQVDIEGEHVPYTGLIKDISSGGLFITTDERHTVGDVIALRFTFPTMEDAVECHAVVRWIRDQYSGGEMASGVGVQFKDLPPETVARINAYIRDKDVPFYDEGF
jgi:uncharacterized protein (TIGR02266 family)